MHVPPFKHGLEEHSSMSIWAIRYPIKSNENAKERENYDTVLLAYKMNYAYKCSLYSIKVMRDSSPVVENKLLII